MIAQQGGSNNPAKFTLVMPNDAIHEVLDLIRNL